MAARDSGRRHRGGGEAHSCTIAGFQASGRHSPPLSAMTRVTVGDRCLAAKRVSTGIYWLSGATGVRMHDRPAFDFTRPDVDIAFPRTVW